MTGNFIPGTATQKFARSGFGHSNATEYKAEASCCALKKKEDLALANVIKVDMPAPVGLHPFFSAVQGFGIHYFLSRIGNDFAPAPSSLFFTLPLFLQHLRLLI